MKYLIKESQIKKFIWDYFNSEDYDISEDDNDIFLLDDYGNVLLKCKSLRELSRNTIYNYRQIQELIKTGKVKLE